MTKTSPERPAQAARDSTIAPAGERNTCAGRVVRERLVRPYGSFVELGGVS